MSATSGIENILKPEVRVITASGSLTPTEKWFLLSLSLNQKREEYTNVSQKILAELGGCPVARISKALWGLKISGMIEGRVPFVRSDPDCVQSWRLTPAGFKRALELRNIAAGPEQKPAISKKRTRRRIMDRIKTERMK
jgi:hypothetical protein